MIGKSLWTQEIEEALVEGRIDIAVHSLKDLPGDLPEGLELGGVLPREDPRDVLITKSPLESLAGLPSGARIGTASTRRRAALLHARPDLVVVPVRGNVGDPAGQVGNRKTWTGSCWRQRVLPAWAWLRPTPWLLNRAI